MASVHPMARLGFQNGAEAYEQGRPDYPAQAIQLLAREFHLDSSKTVLDLAAGTGKLTRLLLSSGARIIAVEPVEAMRRHLAASVAGRAEVLSGTAEAIPLPETSVAAVFVAQAFHWFSNHTALQEIHRVLRPGGHLALIWNARDNRVPWVAELSKIIHDPRKDAPSYATGAWRDAFQGQRWFGELQHRVFEHSQALTAETMRARVASISYVAALDEPGRAELLARVDALFAATDRGHSGIVDLPYQTHVYWCARI